MGLSSNITLLCTLDVTVARASGTLGLVLRTPSSMDSTLAPSVLPRDCTVEAQSLSSAEVHAHVCECALLANGVMGQPWRQNVIPYQERLQKRAINN